MIRDLIQAGKGILGLELGSTRIKAVLVDAQGCCLASGSHSWENQLEAGYWTYSLETVWQGVQACYRDLAETVQREYDVSLTAVAALGVSGMMHGYLPFDKGGNLLTPFRTWRNTTTAEAAEVLTKTFSFNIPQRWSIAHLYQAMRNHEAHVAEIDSLTTLAGYLHWQLTGQRIIGVGEASGMFPIDSARGQYNQAMLAQFESLPEVAQYPWQLKDILPQVLPAGAEAGVLTPKGALLLDPTGTLSPGAPLCPPEGDAGTGMVATNAVAARTGNISAGTSVFAMVVLERPLSRVYPEIDLVTTPTGKPVAMVHCNSCTNEINAWAGLFGELLAAMGQTVSQDKLFEMLFTQSLLGEANAGGLLLYNFLSGEPVAGIDDGRPLLVRGPEGRFTLPNLMRAQLYSAVSSLAMGMELLEKEYVKIDCLIGHGGYFKTPEVGQRIMAAALNTPISVMETAGEGGPWGMALLAAYSLRGNRSQPLEDYLQQQIFAQNKRCDLSPNASDIAGFQEFMQRYKAALPLARAAADYI